jgi:hypothetical protein
MFWALYNAFNIFLALREILTKRHERKNYRFPVIAHGKVVDLKSGNAVIDSRVINLSITGAGLLADEELHNGKRSLLLYIHPEKFDFFTIPIEKYINRPGFPGGKTSIGITFANDLGPHRERLFEYLFIHMPKVDEATHNRFSH